jgi:hypothetical protein
MLAATNRSTTKTASYKIREKGSLRGRLALFAQAFCFPLPDYEFGKGEFWLCS